MKKILLLTTVVSLFFACSKKQTLPPILAKGLYATINDKNEKFNSSDSVFYKPVPTGYLLHIYAADTSLGDTSSVFELELASPSALKPGVYTNSADSTTIASFEYKFSVINSNIYGDYISVDYGKSSVQIIITSVSTNNIQGTFSGTAMPELNSSGNAVITNGTFNFDYK